MSEISNCINDILFFDPNNLEPLLTRLKLTKIQLAELKKTQTEGYSGYGKLLLSSPAGWTPLLSTIQLTDVQKTELKQMHAEQSFKFRNYFDLYYTLYYV